MSKQKVLLVADDSENDFLIVERAFASAGLKHRLVRVAGGHEAIAYLRGLEPFQDRQKWPFPNLLLLDSHMPAGPGVEVLRFLRDRPEIAVPAVVLSGSLAPKDGTDALALGAAEYIHKPNGFSELVVLAQTIHFKWLEKG